MKYLCALILSFTVLTAGAQRVGLVLSGGGARGLYHIGVIRALEENQIPIDYISGTSMGAIVAGLYSIGYTPEEMALLFTSDQVKLWLSGRIESRYFYYFKRMKPEHSMITLNLDLKAKRNIAILPTNLIPSTQLDMSFNEIFAPATVFSDGDFDNLFVPFRCIASDVYNKKEIVYRGGDIGSAIRASMTVPLVFKPLKVDSVLLYDGGIYNNFPWQVLEDDFGPDILIGSKCVAGLKNPDENSIVEQIEALAMTETDYNLPEESGIMINRVFEDIGMLDFAKVQTIMEAGYNDALQMMDSIRKKIPRRTDPDVLHDRRLAFRSQLPDLIFDDYEVQGLSGNQAEYVRRMMGVNDRQEERFSYEEFKSEYFKILSEGEIIGEYPRFVYNDSTGMFKVRLNMRTRPSFRVKFGGNISSTILNQAYVGVEYKTIGRSAHSFRFDGNLSALYSSISGGWRTDSYLTKPFFFDLFYNFNHINYQKGPNWNVFRRYGYHLQDENFMSTSLGFPLGRSSVLKLDFHLGNEQLHYYAHPSDMADQGLTDRTGFNFYGFQLEATKRALNYVLYPTRGIWQKASVIYVAGREKFTPGHDFSGVTPEGKSRRNWFGAKFEREEYLPIARWFTAGYSVDAVVTNLPDFYNSHATNMISPAFNPTPVSKTMYLEKYRNNSYVAVGVAPIIEFSDNFYLKTYGYLYMTSEYLKFEKNETDKIRYIFNSSLVYQTPIGPASLTVTNFQQASKRWFVVFNFGYTLFNKKGLFY